MISKPKCDGCPLNGRPSLLPYLDENTIPKHSLMIIGEAPGRNEVIQHKPFIGMSGKILRAVLQSLNITNFYITNVVMCNPPHNDTPDDETIERCKPRLFSEIEIAQPSGLLLLGATALKVFYPDKNAKISKTRGILFKYKDIPALATFHPAYLLRHSDGFTDFVNDIQKLSQYLRGESTLQIGYTPPTIPITILRTPRDVERARRMLLNIGEASLDLETMGFNPFADKIWTLMFYIPNTGSSVGEAFAIVNPEAQSDEMKAALRSLLELPVKWIGHNAKFDSKFLRIRLRVRWPYKVDTMLMHYAIDERLVGHGLKELAKQYFNAPDYSSEMKKFMDDGILDKVPLEKTLRYQALDCYYTLMLEKRLRREAIADNVLRVHDDLLIPFSHSLEQVEINGFKVDRDYLSSLITTSQQQAQADLHVLQEFASQHGFPNFNPRSPKQVKEVLLATGIRVKSTNAHILDKLAESSEFVKLLLKYRHQEKLLTTYITPLLEKSALDGRVHSEFLLHGTKTGRLASRNPNLQNIPTDIGPVIKEAFIATDDRFLLVNIDFSQLELRVAAWYSQDEKLLQAYENGADIHRIVASEIFKKPPDQITKLERKTAKFIDFGIIYGRGPKSISEQLGIGVSEAAQLLDDFLNGFPRLKQWMQETQRKALSQGYVETPLGRKRRFPLITNEVSAKIERQAVNAPIQSLASDIAQYALMKVQKEYPFIRAVSTVHDSIMFEIPVDAYKYLQDIHHTIETASDDIIEHRVTFEASLEVGQRWGHLEEVEVKRK